MKTKLCTAIGAIFLLYGCGSAPESHIGDSIDCEYKALIGSTLGDFYKEYSNEDWANEKDGEYNITIDSKFVLTWEAVSTKSWMKGEKNNLLEEDKVAIEQKTVIVPYTKVGNKFIPKFNQHWDSKDIRDMKEVMKLAYQVPEGSLFTREEGQCSILNISKKES